MGSLPRKRWLRLVISVMVVSTSVAASCVWIPGGERQSSISVTGLDAGDPHKFTYMVENAEVLMTGGINQFTVALDKAEFFDGLRGAFEVFSESDDRIQVIYRDEVYTIREYDSNGSAYALYGEYVLVNDGGESLARFPFPTDKISGYDPLEFTVYGRTGSGFSITCDFEYLERFYSVYGSSVKMVGSTIQYRTLAMTVRDEGHVEVVVP